MKRFIVRHAQSEANRITRAAFGAEGAPLTKNGLIKAAKLETRLAQLGINANKEAVASSELIRTQQTAELAGFKDINIYPILNEVNTDLSPIELMRMLGLRKLPYEAIRRATGIIENPPTEMTWITHGLVIAGLHEVLGVQNERFIPDFCEITQLDI